MSYETAVYVLLFTATASICFGLGLFVGSRRTQESAALDRAYNSRMASKLNASDL